MNEELKIILLRILPFLAAIVGISIGIKRKKISTSDLYIQKPNSYRNLFVWWFSFLIFIILTEIILYNSGILKVGTWKNSFFPSILKILGMVLLAPIAEELIFRGFFLHKLRQWKLNRHIAIILQALFFVALHSFAYQNTLYANIGIAQVFIDAVLFAYAMYATRSIYTSIVMHATGNLIAVLEQFIL
jgi:membrane protease YdiL (CAAX protease family)